MSYGYLGAIVWPPYVGLSCGDPGLPGTVTDSEPFGDIDYTRGLITWRTESDGEIVGSAHVYAPKGIYTHVVFFSGPDRVHTLMGSRQFEQPIVFDRAGVVEIDPIQNKEYLPRR